MTEKKQESLERKTEETEKKPKQKNKFTGLFETSAETLRDRIHELIHEGIVVRHILGRSEIKDNVDFENDFKCYKDGIEIAAEPDEVSHDERCYCWASRSCFDRYLLISASEDDEYGVMEFYFPTKRD